MSDPTDAELDAIAARLGLTDALAIDRGAFAAALAAADGLRARVRAPESIAEEPAHVYVPPAVEPEHD